MTNEFNENIKENNAMDILKYRNEGRAAYLRNVPQWSNPYKTGTEEYADWQQGFEDAKTEHYGRKVR